MIEITIKDIVNKKYEKTSFSFPMYQIKKYFLAVKRYQFAYNCYLYNKNLRDPNCPLATAGGNGNGTFGLGWA